MAEKEYIERNAVVNGLRAAIKKYSDDKSEANIITALIFQRFAKEIEAIPAADVAPVRHGQWVKEKKDVLIHWHCSTCRECYFLEEPNAKYCPHCGARMDGEPDANPNE